MDDGRIVQLDEESFDDAIRGESGTILVDFWASWCRPCKILAPRLVELAEELRGRARIAKVNVEEAANLANRYHVRSVPTLMLFRDGRVVDQMVGAAPTEQIRRLVEKHVTPV